MRVKDGSFIKKGAVFPNHVFLWTMIDVMKVSSWAEDNFCFISDCRNSFYPKTYKRANNHFLLPISQSNELSSSEKSVQMGPTFTSMCFLFIWFKLQILNLLIKSHRVLRDWANVHMCVIAKTKRFYSYTTIQN